VSLSGILTAGELYLFGAGGTLSVGLYHFSDFSGPLTLLETRWRLRRPAFYSFSFSTPVTADNTLALLVDVSEEGDSITFPYLPIAGYAAGVQLNVIPSASSNSNRAREVL
jgi:hypothetical protein